MWNENSAARLTALRVKKTLNSLVHQDYTVMHINGKYSFLMITSFKYLFCISGEVGSQFNSET